MPRRSPPSAVASPCRSGFRRPPRRQPSTAAVPLPPPPNLGSPDSLAAHDVPLPNSPKPDAVIDSGGSSSSSSSTSGTDSESSSDTESTSHTGSTSDSETDGSPSGKQGTDCEVDIMSEDEKQQNATVKPKSVALDKTPTSEFKRSRDSENFQEKPDSVKRSKSTTPAQALFYEKTDYKKCGSEKHNQELSVLQRGLSYRECSKENSENKGPIKEFTQFEEYVQEYCEKYARYRSLNMELENTRNAFLRVKNDLEDAKDKDSKECILLEELKELYIRHGVRHRQHNTIFILLHEELKNLKGIIWDFAQAYAKE